MYKNTKISNIAYQLLWKCLLLLLVGMFTIPVTSAKASANDDLKKISNQITELKDYFSKTAEKDPTNKGADKLKKTSITLLETINGFQNQEVSKDSLASVLQKALRECRRFRSPNAQKLETEIKALQALLPQIESKTSDNETASSPRRRKLDKNDVSKESQSESELQEPKITFSDENVEGTITKDKVTIKNNSKTSGGDYTTNPMVYVLFAVFIVVMIFFGYFLYNTQIRQTQTLTDQIKFLENELNTIREKDTTVQGMDGATFMAMAEIKKRLENLEKNTVDFLQMTDERISKIENRAEKLAGLAPIEAAVLHADHKKMHAIEEKIHEMERKISPGGISATIVPNAIKIDKKYDVQIVDHLIEAIQILAQHTDIGLLKTVCGDVNILLKLSVAKRTWEDIDPYSLATLLQLAYVSAVNEQQDDTYQLLVHNSLKLGYNIHEKMVGKPILGLELAENITFDNYLNNPKVKNEEYPNFKAIKQQIERKFRLNETENGIILSVLQPAITLQTENHNSIVLQKGKYVIKS